MPARLKAVTLLFHVEQFSAAGTMFHVEQMHHFAALRFFYGSSKFIQTQSSTNPWE
jgi:hypothetical protein